MLLIAPIKIIIFALINEKSYLNKKLAVLIAINWPIMAIHLKLIYVFH